MNPRSCNGSRKVGVGAVRQVRPVTAAAPSTRRRLGRPPPNGSEAGRSRLQHSASTDSTPPPSRSGVEGRIVGQEDRLRCRECRQWCRAGPCRRSRRPSARRVRPRGCGSSRWNGLPRPELAARQALTHALDRPDLQAAGPPHVGLDTILDARLVERNRLAALLEEVDDRRAAERQAVAPRPSVRDPAPSIEIDEDVHAVARRDQRLGVEPARNRRTGTSREP